MLKTNVFLFKNGRLSQTYFVEYEKINLLIGLTLGLNCTKKAWNLFAKRMTYRLCLYSWGITFLEKKCSGISNLWYN